VGTVVVDADVLIAFVNPDDAQHALADERLTPWIALPHRVLVPASVYSEILVAPVRRGTGEDIDLFLVDLRADVVDVSREIAWRAAHLRAQNPSLRLPDAFTAATALQRRADLLTLDLKLQKIWERIG
jgi:predicted nucleic acid-binding protein